MRLILRGRKKRKGERERLIITYTGRVSNKYFIKTEKKKGKEKLPKHTT